MKVGETKTTQNSVPSSHGLGAPSKLQALHLRAVSGLPKPKPHLNQNPIQNSFSSQIQGPLAQRR